MRRLILKLFSLSLLMNISPLQADAGWTDIGNVVELVPTSRHYYEFSLSVTSSSGCRNKSWYYQDYASRGAQQMFDTLLEAVRSGLRVRVFVTGVCNIDGYSEISSISISP